MSEKSLKDIIENEKIIGCRWSSNIPHHSKSIQLIKFLAEIDYECYNDYFLWKFGGDGDNGETLAYQLDAYFENELSVKNE